MITFCTSILYNGESLIHVYRNWPVLEEILNEIVYWHWNLWSLLKILLLLVLLLLSFSIGVVVVEGYEK